MRVGDRPTVGVVVTFAWMFSKRQHLVPYTRLYGASGCDSLVCHPSVLNLWFPSRAEALAVQILDELAKEVKDNPRPIVFATFSGGAKTCLYKILQILQGTGETGSQYAGKYRAVETCVRGQVHDSSPIDFVSALGARFASFTVSQMLGWSNPVVPAISHAVANVMDFFFLPAYELQRADFWLTLKQSSKLGPFLIFCSTNDHLAPYNTINEFATVLRELGGQVDLVVWDTSDHVGHLRNYPKEYHGAVKSFLDRCLNVSNTYDLKGISNSVSLQDQFGLTRNLLINSKL